MITATNVSFDEKRLVVELSDGRSIAAPIDWFPKLVGATLDQRGNWESCASGAGVHWPEIDEDISVDGLLSGRRAP